MNGLLKFITCGSVDDGKSTLIGHILYDAKLLYADQARALELDSKVGSRGGAIDYSLLLDGLMAEREQGITIDVAYRYFTTGQRSFIVADTPGHEEYTRNMAVGASFAQLAVILVDAKQGVLIQTRRHARICALMGIRHFVFAVNKMDLVGYQEERFREIKAQIKQLSRELELVNVVIIPVSATEGDNVTQTSSHMGWYRGEPLLSYLEQVDVEEQSHERGSYVPVQRVCRPDRSFRGFQGQLECGSVSVGDQLYVLPGSERAGVKSILVGDQPVVCAQAGSPVTIRLDREVDVSRGCVLSKEPLPVSNRLTAAILWMDDEQLKAGKSYWIKLGTKTISGVLKKIDYKVDVNTGAHKKTWVLQKNEIAVCELMLQERIVLDAFSSHRTLGELILVDSVTNRTAACGVVREPQVSGLTDKPTVVDGECRMKLGLFEEMYYAMDCGMMYQTQAQAHSYAVGEQLPLCGETYCYPSDFDVIALRGHMTASVRGGRLVRVCSLSDYAYADVPVVCAGGFALRVHNLEEFEDLRTELIRQGQELSGDFCRRWLLFDVYRKVQITAQLPE